MNKILVLGGYVEDGGMDLVCAQALRQVPSRRFSPSPLVQRFWGPVKTMVSGCIRKTGRARTFEA